MDKETIIILAIYAVPAGIGIFFCWLRKKNLIVRRVCWGVLALTVILFAYGVITGMSDFRHKSQEAKIKGRAGDAWVLDDWLSGSLKTGKDSKKTEIDTDGNGSVEAGKDMTNAELAKAGVCAVWIALQNKKMKNPYAGGKLPEGVPLWTNEDRPGQISCIQEGDKITINAFKASGTGKDNLLVTRTIVPELSIPQGSHVK